MHCSANKKVPWEIEGKSHICFDWTICLSCSLQTKSQLHQLQTQSTNEKTEKEKTEKEYWHFVA